MLFGSVIGDLFGNCFLWLILILWAVGQLIYTAAKNPDVQDVARESFWSWFFGE